MPTSRKAVRQRCYLCIDLKSFYASVECADRGLDPFRENLVVADPDRGRGTICLAITPAMKAAGVRNRCRVFEIPDGMPYTMAPPRMRRYMEVSAQINGIYLQRISPDDLYVYSIDECFIDATPYLSLYGLEPRALARQLINAVRTQTGITATAGIGTNLFLAKVALDVTAKHAPDGIGCLNEESFKQHIWWHTPLTDIWGIGPGIARRLAHYGVRDLAGVCAMHPETLHREFGKNATCLLDHALGQEPCTIADIKAYRPKAHSITNSQVLMRDYSVHEARTVLREMIDTSVLELAKKDLSCSGVNLHVGLSAVYVSPEHRYTPGVAHSQTLTHPTRSAHILTEVLLGLYDKTMPPNVEVRRLSLGFSGLIPDAAVQPSLFNVSNGKAARERALADVAVAVRTRFGKNALLRGTSLQKEATARERNCQVGGHRAE